MGRQVTVRLPAPLAEALARRAKTAGQRPSEIVREALAEHLAIRTPERVAERVRSLLGAFDTGCPDLAESHREAVLESLRRGR